MNIFINSMFRQLSFALLSCSIMPAIAQDNQMITSEGKTQFKTSSFLGIALDKPFPGNMPKCPKHELFDAADISASSELGYICFFPKNERIFEIHNSPDLGFGYTLETMTFQGKPLVFRITLGKKKFNQLSEIFTERYGSTYHSFTEQLKTGAGDLYSSRVRKWKNSDLEIKLNEIGEDVLWSEATIENVKLRSIFIEKIKSTTKEAAKNL